MVNIVMWPNVSWYLQGLEVLCLSKEAKHFNFANADVICRMFPWHKKIAIIQWLLGSWITKISSCKFHSCRWNLPFSGNLSAGTSYFRLKENKSKTWGFVFVFLLVILHTVSADAVLSITKDLISLWTLGNTDVWVLDKEVQTPDLSSETGIGR